MDQPEDKGLAEAATTAPAPVKTDMKEKDKLLKLKELLIPVDRNKALEVKTASGLRG